MSANKNTKFKCPFCDRRYIREDLITHVADNHDDMIPEGYTAFQLVFNSVNRKPLNYHGCCTECKGPTKWDEDKGRYDRQCGSQKCKDSYLKKFEDNMMRTKGVSRISSTAEGQEKMLANRKISGTYKFQNGETKTYTGSYELKALQFMDKVLNINPMDIMCPGPVLEYTYNGTKHMYITDFYYIPYNLVIEVKDGGKNPNKRNMPEYRGKQIAKEEFIIKNTNYNYLRLTDNDLSQLMSVFADLKMQMVENTGERVIHVNEAMNLDSVIIESDNSKDNFKTIKDFNKELNKWDYGVLINGKVETDSSKIDWSKYKTIPIKDIEKYHVGICWDFVNYETWWLNNNNIKSTAYFFVMSRNEDNSDIITHTFITLKIDGILYWFESSWMKHQGLHEIKSYKDVVEKLRERYGNKYSYDVFRYNPKGLDNHLTNSEFFNKAMQTKVESYTASNEAMNALMTGYIPGMKDADSCYIVNYMQNNVFSGDEERGYGISDNIKLTNLIIRDKEGKLDKAPDNFLENCKYDVFKINMSSTEISSKLENYIGEFVSESFLYETVFGKKMYTYDQIYTEESAKPVDDFYYTMNAISEATREYILTGNIKNNHPDDKLDSLTYAVNYLRYKTFNESKDISVLDDNFKTKSGLKFEYIDINSKEALKYITKEWLNGKNGEIAVCTNDDKLAGYIYVNKSGTIAPLGVYKKYRGYGVSRVLMTDAITKFGGNNLGVYSDNEIAIKLYKSLGFVVVDQKKYSDGSIVLIMKLKK